MVVRSRGKKGHASLKRGAIFSNLVIKHIDVFRRPVPKYFPYSKIAENGFYESDISVVLNVIAI